MPSHANVTHVRIYTFNTMHTDTLAHSCRLEATSSTFPEATAWLKALCHFHHKRVSCEMTNFSLQLVLLSADAFIFQSRAWIFQGWVTDPVKNEKREGVAGSGEGGPGRSREVWVITFGFADLINDLSLTDFNQTTLVFVIFIDFHQRLLSLSLCISLSPLVSVVPYKSVMNQEETLMLAGPNFTVPQWVCLGRNQDKWSLSCPGSFIPQLSYYHQTGISISKLPTTREGMQNWT